MPLIKVECGLLEEENFYLTSPISDFLGDGIWSRTQEKFILKSGEIKRRLPYKESFVIDVKKETAELDKFSEFIFFIESNDKKFGIREVKGNENNIYWKIIYSDGFIQIYSSDDNMNWINKGGCDINLGEEIFQGFRVIGKNNLVITDYKVYSSPFLKLQNFEPNTLVHLYNISDTLIKQRLFDSSYECKIFLDCKVKGYLKIFSDSTLEKLLYTSPVYDFDLGDVFLFSNEFIQLIYKGKVLTYQTTDLINYNEHFIIKNSSEIQVLNICVEVINPNSDDIKMSLDKESYFNKICIGSLEPNEEKDMYLKITKDLKNPNFSRKQFDIKIY